MHQALKESCFLKLPKGNNLNVSKSLITYLPKAQHSKCTFTMHIYGV